MDLEHLLKGVLASVVYSGLGLTVFVGGFYVLRKTLPSLPT